jgi:uncharacterized protein related to proFAR isomerase
MARNETHAERLARISEQVRVLQQSDIEMAEAIKSLNKIVVVGNGVPSLSETVRALSKTMTEFIAAELMRQTEKRKEEDENRRWWRRLIVGASATTIISTSIPLLINAYLLWIGK